MAHKTKDGNLAANTAADSHLSAIYQPTISEMERLSRRDAVDSEDDCEVDSAETLIEKLNKVTPHRGPQAKTKPRKKPVDIDSELESINRKLYNVAFDESAAANAIPEAMFHLPNDQNALIHLLPYHGQSIISALSSDVSEYVLNAVKQVRRYMCADEIKDKTERVLELNIFPRLTELLETSNMNIQYEICWVITNIAAGTSTHTTAVVDAGLVPVLIKLLSANGDQVRVQAAWALGNVAGDCKAYTQTLLDSGIMTPLLKIVDFESLSSRKLMQARHVVCWVIANLCRWEANDWTQIEPCFELLRNTVLYCQDSDVLSEAIWALSRIFLSKHAGNSVLITHILMKKLVNLMETNRLSVQTPVLRVMTNVSGEQNHSHTQILIDAGIVPAIFNILNSRFEYNPQIISEVLHCLSNITAGTTEQKEEVRLAKLFPLVRNSLQFGDVKVKKEAVHVLRNAVDRDATPEQFRDIVGHEGELFSPLTKFLADSAADPETQHAIVETLNIIFSRGNEPLIRNLYPFAQPDVNVYVTAMHHVDRHNFQNIWQAYSRISNCEEELAPLLYQCVVADQEVKSRPDLESKNLQKQVVDHVVGVMKPGMTAAEIVKSERAKRAVLRDLRGMFEMYLSAERSQVVAHDNDVDFMSAGLIRMGVDVSE
ncbi:Importin alpha subunit (Karyopherin alpha subunit) (Serine-rich RNA polymerase I suppressor protein) [Chytriomyces hyalinus]|nr:Importin alpha subunit (Karyopherin alpha subunit) (Serine-rich RNA polymerase I suppressor protein) [Chytriomyces hyalinus]